MTEKVGRGNKLPRNYSDPDALAHIQQPSEHAAQVASADRDHQPLASLILEDMQHQLDRLLAEVARLTRRQDYMGQKHEEAEVVHRGQIDCISERIYQAEKNLRQTEERQDDAIAKAGTAFQKHACDMEQERQNLMCVITQVNQNFDHLSSEIGLHTGSIRSLQDNSVQLEQALVESRHHGVSLAVLGQEMQQMEQSFRLQLQRQAEKVLRAEEAVQQQHDQIHEVKSHLRLAHESVLQLASSQSGTSPGARREFEEQVEELRSLHCDFQMQYQDFNDQLGSMREEVQTIIRQCIADEMNKLMEGLNRPVPPAPSVQGTACGGSSARRSTGRFSRGGGAVGISEVDELAEMLRQSSRTNHVTEDIGMRAAAGRPWLGFDMYSGDRDTLGRGPEGVGTSQMPDPQRWQADRRHQAPMPDMEPLDQLQQMQQLQQMEWPMEWGTPQASASSAQARAPKPSAVPAPTSLPLGTVRAL